MTTTPTTATVLDVENVHHRYDGDPVLKGVSLRAQAGTVHCLLGPSGCGKSTLLRLIAGLETLQTGSVRWDDRSLASAGPDGRASEVPAEHRGIGFMFQDGALFPHLSVRRNVEFGLVHLSATARRAASDALLARVDLADFASAMPHTLSGGQQQRVALARALAREPTVMLLDEPFSSLDARLRETVRSGVLDVLRRAGVATVMVTHDPAEALQAGDAISVIDDGRVLQSGSPSDLYRRPHTCAIAEMFGPINRFEGALAQDDALGPVVETPLGRLSVAVESDVDAGTVDVVVRPEAVQVVADVSTGTLATIESIALEGPTALLTLDGGYGDPIRARVLESDGWRVGDQVALRVVEGRSLAFPLSSRT